MHAGVYRAASLIIVCLLIGFGWTIQLRSTPVTQAMSYPAQQINHKPITYPPTTERQTLMLTATPTPSGTPTGIVFDVDVLLAPSSPQVEIGATLVVNVTMQNNGNCPYYAYDVTLSQDEPAMFRFESPRVVGPPVYETSVFTLTAIQTGTTHLRAGMFGERFCGFGWQQAYVGSDPLPITVNDPAARTIRSQLFVPQIINH